MSLDPYTAFDAMTLAFNRGDHFAAASLAVALHVWLNAGSKEALQFSKRHAATILEIERTSKKHLERESKAHV